MYSPLASPSATREVLERHELLLKHSLGQNFLVNDHIIGKILKLASLEPGERVLEVGPGIGTLTLALLGAGAHVLAIEADPALPAVLEENCADYADQLELISGDAMKLDFSGFEVNKLISNLPYQVAASVVLKAFESIESLRSATVMVQAEVADRMGAQSGTKAYSAYTAKLALFARVVERFEVSPSNFMPAPHVNSSVVHLDRQASGLTSKQTQEVKQLIDAAFAQRRKTIRNSMAASGFEKDALDAAFEQAGVSPSCRAETLTLDDFIRLASYLEVPKKRTSS